MSSERALAAPPRLGELARLVAEAVRLVWRAGPGWALAQVALVPLQAVLPLGMLFVTKLIIDLLVEGAAAGRGAEAGRVTGLIAVAAALAGAMMILAALAGFVRDCQRLRFADSMQSALHAKAVALDLQYYEDPRYYDTLHRAQSEGGTRPLLVVDTLIQVARSTAVLVATVGLLFRFGWQLPALVLAASLPGIFLRYRQEGRVHALFRRQAAAERQVGYYNSMLTDQMLAKEVRLFGLGSLLSSRFAALRAALRGERQAIFLQRVAVTVASEVPGLLAIFGAYALLAFRALAGGITVGDLVLYMEVFRRGVGGFNGILGGLVGLHGHRLFLRDVAEFLALEPAVAEPVAPRPFPRPLREGIAFDGVCFGYPAGRGICLRDVDLVVRPGETVALVGPNGAGKTTLVKLLCRFYDPTSGAIRVDGVDLRELRLEELRRELAVLFQEYGRYQLPARENIWFGDITLPRDSPRIRRAARMAGAERLIDSLPRGFSSLLGRWFEGGTELSFGEWQRVALARALLRRAQIAVLDEPTSALDPESEKAVVESFLAAIRGRTAIIVSHRLSTVHLVDRICVMEEGAIVEQGTHEQLLRCGGRYARLFEFQLAARWTDPLTAENRGEIEWTGRES